MASHYRCLARCNDALMFIAVRVVLFAAVSQTGGRPETAERSHSPGLILDHTWQWLATVTPVENITVQ